MAEIININGKSLDETPAQAANTLRSEQLEAAAMELHLARSVVSAMHDVFSDKAAEVAAEAIANDSLSGVLYDVLLRIRKAEDIINELQRV